MYQTKKKIKAFNGCRIDEYFPYIDCLYYSINLEASFTKPGTAI